MAIDAKWIDFQELGDSRGSLVAIEIGSEKNIPFDVKRIYYIYRTEKGIKRGFHAHKKLKQVAFAIHGKCKMVLDNGLDRKTVILDSPTRGLFIDNCIWREMEEFSDDCVLLVIASEHYDENDYIRDYEEFLKEVGA